MKKLLLAILMILCLTACCDEQEVRDCANRDNGLSYETCHYQLCR